MYRSTLFLLAVVIASFSATAFSEDREASFNLIEKIGPDKSIPQELKKRIRIQQQENGRHEKEILFQAKENKIGTRTQDELDIEVWSQFYFRHAYGDTYVVMADVKNVGSRTHCFVKINLDFRNSANSTIATDFTYVNGTNRTLPSIDMETDTCLLPGEVGFLGTYVDVDYDAVASTWYSVETDTDPTTTPDAKIHISSGPNSQEDYAGEVKLSGTMKNIGSATGIFCKANFALKKANGAFLDVDMTYVDGSQIGGSSSGLRVGDSGNFLTYTSADYTYYSYSDHKTAWDDYGSSTSCTYSISPTTASYPSAGGTGSISVAASQTNCVWDSRSNASWIHITSGMAGMGNGSVIYSVDANPGSSTRTGTITVQDMTFRVSQAAPSCSYSISPGSAVVDATGGTGTVSISTQSGCSWVVSNNHSWIDFSVLNGTGSGTTQYSVSANNTGSERSGQVSIAGRFFTITQSYKETPTEENVYWVAGIAHTSGSGGSRWLSNLVICNSSRYPAELSLSFFSENGPVTRSFSLPKNEIKEWVDVVNSLFGYSGDIAGAVRVESDQKVMVEARTYNDSDEGTFGQFMPGITVSDSLSFGEDAYVNQLKKTSSFRSNLGFVNPTEMDCDVWVKLVNSSGTTIGRLLTITVPGSGWIQQNDVFGAAGINSCDLSYAAMELVQQGCRVWSYGSVVDNRTGDPTTIPMVIGAQ